MTTHPWVRIEGVAIEGVAIEGVPAREPDQRRPPSPIAAAGSATAVASNATEAGNAKAVASSATAVTSSAIAPAEDPTAGSRGIVAPGEPMGVAAETGEAADARSHRPTPRSRMPYAAPVTATTTSAADVARRDGFVIVERSANRRPSR